MSNYDKIKLDISAVVVSLNEDDYLEECLVNLDFCCEIIVIDLKSTDETPHIAKKYATKYIVKEAVPFVEEIRKWAVDIVKYEWVLFVDPDEIYSHQLQSEIRELFKKQIKSNIALIIDQVYVIYREHLLRAIFIETLF